MVYLLVVSNIYIYIYFCVHPYLWKWCNLTWAYFSDGLVQPPTSLGEMSNVPMANSLLLFGTMAQPFTESTGFAKKAAGSTAKIKDFDGFLGVDDFERHLYIYSYSQWFVHSWCHWMPIVFSPAKVCLGPSVLFLHTSYLLLASQTHMRLRDVNRFAMMIPKSKSIHVFKDSKLEFSDHPVLFMTYNEHGIGIHGYTWIFICTLKKYLHILPGKLTCPLKINGWKMYFLFK